MSTTRPPQPRSSGGVGDARHDELTAAASDANHAVLVRGATLTVTAGPDRGASAHVDQLTFILGTGETSALKLTDPTISREHLRLTLAPHGLVLRDKGSKNGTWLAGARIAEATLTADATIKVGGALVNIALDATPIRVPLSEHASFGQAIGVSAAMRNLFHRLASAAASDVTVLLEGESGVGKEVLARAVHDASLRAGGPFVALDCGAIAPTLIESILFGHERGAFTGADRAREGVFEEAHGGTLFLDEIGELPLDLQPKLLRVLELREVRPLGGNRVRPFDVRIIAATNQKLLEAVEKNAFRRDLFYRLAVARMVVPALRDRPEDVVPLAEAFLQRLTSTAGAASAGARLPPDFAAMLTAYAWPGNVRELRNVVERYAVLGMRGASELFDWLALPSGIPNEAVYEQPFHEARRLVVERFEREYIDRALTRAGGVVVRAAEQSQIARASFYRLLERTRAGGGTGAPGGGAGAGLVGSLATTRADEVPPSRK